MARYKVHSVQLLAVGIIQITSETVGVIDYNGLCCLLEVSVQLRFDEDDTVKQLLDHSVLVLIVLLCDLAELDLGLLVDGDLGTLCAARMLWRRVSLREERDIVVRGRTDASKALNSSSLSFLYSSISFVASVRASLSRCTLSVMRRCELRRGG